MAHVHEKIDFTVSVYVVCKNRVLLRKHEKYGFWLGPGGHVELSEDPPQAALREVKEEVGLDVVLWDGNKKFSWEKIWNDGANNHRELIPPVALNRHKISETHEHVDLVYFAASDSDAVVPENSADQWRWLTYDEIDSFDAIAPVQFYAKLALDTLGNR